MSARRSGRGRSAPVKLVFWFNVALLFALGGWYLAQSATRQEEVRMLVGNYLEREKRVALLDIVRDIWTLYYSDQFVAVERPRAGAHDALFAGGARIANGAQRVRVLENRGYVVGYSDALRTPLWAAYRTWDLERIPVPPERPDKFAEDARTVARVRPEEYSGSGYDRGHLAPNYAIATHFGAEAQVETFLMSNIVPQKHALNAGLWKDLELRAATSYPARFREVWVMAGPVFGARPAHLRGGVPVPEACWMVLVDEHEGRVRAQAFLFPQDATAEGSLAQYLTSVDRIEALTGLDLVPDLPDAAEAALEAQVASSVW
ncbi:MAG TPA: DNA/RNA non-specific endonuclease [Opitutaceae bacterium]|nr:DNA/RNA non-specific endonuclease [Opitutaceae bacterium]